MTCYLWYFIKTQLYKKNNKECIYSIKPIFHEYVPILIEGAYGEYSSIINGEYIPLCCPYTETNYYKKWIIKNKQVFISSCNICIGSFNIVNIIFIYSWRYSSW